MYSAKIGIMDESVAKLKGGPKVFMLRLKEKMIEKNIYSEREFSKWINLSFRKIPDFVIKRKNEVEIIVRFDGVWNDSLIPKLLPKILKDKLDLRLFKFFNKVILDNYNLADKVIYQSEYSKFTIENLLFNRFGIKENSKKSIIIYNGVDLNKFKPIKFLKNADSFPNILISHRMIPFKRAHQAPLIISKLIKYYPNLKVHIVGGGIKNPYHFNEDTLNHLSKVVKKEKLEKYFKFYGYINPNDLPSVYNKCDFMLNLSYADPCPNVVVESIACGLPVIAPNSGGIPELVKYKELIVEEDINMNDFQPRFIYRDLPLINSDKYIDKILKIVENLDYFSIKMRERAEKYFNIDKVADQYIDFINS